MNNINSSVSSYNHEFDLPSCSMMFLSRQAVKVFLLIITYQMNKNEMGDGDGDGAVNQVLSKFL